MFLFHKHYVRHLHGGCRIKLVSEEHCQVAQSREPGSIAGANGSPPMRLLEERSGSVDLDRDMMSESKKAGKTMRSLRITLG